MFSPRFSWDKKRIAQTLWIAWAIFAWNVVLDRVIVVAGREYLAAARLAAAGVYPRMDDWMRPAVTRGFWTATAVSAAILIVGFAAIRLATRQGTEGRR